MLLKLNRLQSGIIPSSSAEKENKKFKRFRDNKGSKTKKFRFSDSKLQVYFNTLRKKNNCLTLLRYYFEINSL